MKGLSFVVGFIIGSLFGVIVMCCLQIDRMYEDEEKKKKITKS